MVDVRFRVGAVGSVAIAVEREINKSPTFDGCGERRHLVRRDGVVLDIVLKLFI